MLLVSINHIPGQDFEVLGMVSIVSNNSSSMPAMRQLNATRACSRAKEWIIH